MRTANPIRQYASAQSMRPPENGRVIESRDSFLKDGQAAQSLTDHSHLSNGRHEIGQQSQGNRFPVPVRKSSRPTTPNTETLAAATRKDSGIAIPPLPDLHHRLRQVRLDRRNVVVNHGAPDHSSEALRSPQSPTQSMAHQHEIHKSRSSSPLSAHYHPTNDAQEPQGSSIGLAPLQNVSMLDPHDQMEPLEGEQAGSFDLVAPAGDKPSLFSLEARSMQLFSSEHLKVIFSDATLLLRFTAYLSTHRPQSVPILIYYLDALKALKAIKYANAIAEALSPIQGHGFTSNVAPPPPISPWKTKRIKRSMHSSVTICPRTLPTCISKPLVRAYHSGFRARWHHTSAKPRKVLRKSSVLRIHLDRITLSSLLLKVETKAQDYISVD